MKNQTGFCKMTGFNTISRTSSGGPRLFTSGRVKFGVGLSQYEFGSRTIRSIYDKTEGSLVCGMCINITQIKNLPKFNFELSDYENVNVTESHVAMIFDQCNDLICSENFLDIDVYADNIFYKSNTYDVKWTAIDCPVYENESFEYLICTSHTCNAQDIAYINSTKFISLFNPIYFSIVIRNIKSPIKSLSIWYSNKWYKLPYISGNGYTWDDYNKPFFEYSLKFKINDIFNHETIDEFLIDDVLECKPLDNYRGGIIISKDYQCMKPHAI